MTSLTVCHCEERSDAGIHSFLARQDGLLRFARNDELVDRAQFTELLTTTSITFAPGRLKADDKTEFNWDGSVAFVSSIQSDFAKPVKSTGGSMKSMPT